MQDLRKKILNLGASLVGFADLRKCLPKEFEDYPNGISIAVKLDDKIIDRIKNGPTKEYDKLYREVNHKLDKIAIKTKEIIEKKGYRAFIIEASNITDNEELKGLFPHKTAATQSGLGWIGKCALLVTKEYGPRVRLVTVLTDALLKTDSPIIESLCSTCKICKDYCPGNASKGINWNINMEREDIYDAAACNKVLKGFESKLGLDICGICVSRCPYGIKNKMKFL